jgi:hypothetical protein
MKAACALLFVVICLPGCIYIGARSSIGQTFSPAAIAKIEPGVTTRSQMLALFGPPHEFLEPEVSAALIDDSLRLDAALDVARRSEQAWTWQSSKIEATGTFLLLYGGVWIETDTQLLVAFFDDQGVVQHVAVTRREETP